MSQIGWGRTAHALLALACVLAIGVVVGLNLPFGAKPLTVTRGTAAISVDGDGSFQADRGGVTAYLPRQVTGAESTCLRHGEGEYMSAPVEAGYVETRDPDGGCSYVVGWIRCL